MADIGSEKTPFYIIGGVVLILVVTMGISRFLRRSEGES
jgi:hypothetical protein